MSALLPTRSDYRLGVMGHMFISVSAVVPTGQRHEDLERRQDGQRRGEEHGVCSGGGQQQSRPGAV